MPPLWLKRCAFDFLVRRDPFPLEASARRRILLLAADRVAWKRGARNPAGGQPLARLARG